MSPLNCCIRSRLRLNVDGWLIPESDLKQFWMTRLQLFKCPSCGQLWLWRSELVGHQEYDITWAPLESAEAFELAAAMQVAKDTRRQAELKQEYERLGLEWPSGRKL